MPIILTTGRYRIPTVVRRSSVAPKLTGGVTVGNTGGIYYGFPRAVGCLPTSGTILAKSPVEHRLFDNITRGTVGLYGFPSRGGPIVLVVKKDLNSGGIGRTIHRVLPRLLGSFCIVRLYKGNGLSGGLTKVANCTRFRCTGTRLASVFTLTSVTVSETKTGSVYRLLTLRGPGVLVPLSTTTDHKSRMLGTGSFGGRNFSCIVRRRRLAGSSLLDTMGRICDGESGCGSTVTGDNRVSSVTAVVSLVGSRIGGSS